jgi:ankyrin repeat protein
LKFKRQLTPWEAACLGDAEQLNEFIKNTPSLINTPSPDGFSLLGYACFFSQENIAALLISKGADINSASKNSMKVAPLHSAAASSNYALCSLLLENGADINAVQQGGYTALHAAAQNGKTELVKLFLVNGADKNLLTEKGESAVSFAIAGSHMETARFIEDFSK